jgi:hypothetical protein
MKHLRIFESHIDPIQEAELGKERLASKKGTINKKMANFFNKYYKMNLPLDGNWKNPEYIKAFTRFCTENKIQTWTCKPGDGWCSDEQAGEVTVKDPIARAKFNKIMKNALLTLLMKP